jgi:NADH:ubiquinone oxidoreductase subunit 4 (subunit M)
MPFVYTLCILAILYGSCTTIRQIDLKKIIAYASIAHMNYVVLGVLSTTSYGIAGSFFLMISHGFVSAGLFFLIGFLYDRYKTRILLYYGGLMYFMPKFAFYFILFTLANISFPGTSNFIGEFLVLLSLYDDNFFINILSTIAIIFGAIYSIWLCNRLLFGISNKYIKTYSDLVSYEIYIMNFLSFFVIFIGLYPIFFLEKIEIIIYDILIIK